MSRTKKKSPVLFQYALKQYGACVCLPKNPFTWLGEKSARQLNNLDILIQRVYCLFEVMDMTIREPHILLPKHDPNKRNLPKRRNYVGALAWLRAVRECLGSSFVFALDSALMCQGSFGGRSNEYLVWGYGDQAAANYNGVMLLGNQIAPADVAERDGLRFTNFSRTLADSLVHESILDMQGITEAISRYYFTHGESFAGMTVAPEHRERFENLAADARAYYKN